jgi:ribosomal protein S18 acetylase RimI-like enzyme
MTNVVPMPRLTVRRARPQDVEPVATLLHRLWHETYATHVPAEAAAGWTLASLRADLEPRIQKAWVGWLGSRLVGYCAVSANCIEDLWVSARHQRRGIGTRLLDAALADLDARGYQAAQAGCEDFNTAARAFLEHHGWRVIGEEPQPRDPSGRVVRALVYSRPVPAEGRHPGTVREPLRGRERGSA